MTGKFKPAMGVVFLWSVIAIEAICLACIWIVLHRRPSVRRKIVVPTLVVVALTGLAGFYLPNEGLAIWLVLLCAIGHAIELTADTGERKHRETPQV